MLVLCMADRVGALHDVLQAFQHRSVNLARIESRPSRTKIWCSKFPPPSARPWPSLSVHASISIHQCPCEALARAPKQQRDLWHARSRVVQYSHNLDATGSIFSSLTCTGTVWTTKSKRFNLSIPPLSSLTRAHTLASPLTHLNTSHMH